MNYIDYLALSPLLFIFATALILLLLETCLDKPRTLCSYTMLVGLGLALYAAYRAPASINPLLTPWLNFDSLTRFFSMLFISIGIITTFISSPFFKTYDPTRGEFYFFILSALFGLILIAASNDFLTLFLGLETLSIALYVLCSYVKSWTLSHEAAFKYFLLGSISTAFFLFGVALIYGATGTTNFDMFFNGNILFISGIALVTLSLLFKAAVVPFHIWAPDVYAGAPLPVTAFMAVGTKAGAFAALIRIFLQSIDGFNPLWHNMIAFLAYPTLIYANFVAMQQTELRRFFAYSGISHAGFLLIPLAAATPDATSSMLFYIVVYTIATLGCFACLSFVRDTSLSSLKGLFYSSPLLACTFALCLLTLGGIPPTVGFFAKFYILKVGFEAGYYGLVIVGLLTTILSAYYYLRIVAVMFSEKSTEQSLVYSRQAYLASSLSLVLIVLLSFYPGIVSNLLP